MWSGKCKSGSGLCPVSFGLAAGITYALAMLVMALIIIVGWAPAEMAAVRDNITAWMVIVHMFWALIEGFVFGFVMAGFYDLFLCCRGCKCCKKSDGGTCNCSCHSGDKKVEQK